MSETLGQGLTLAEKSGLGVDKLFEWVQILWPGPYVEYASRMVQGQYHARDELRHLEGVKKRQGAKVDMTGIYGMIREESGLPFENEV
ncbi:putative 6-phosphogluconate dehydrogenase NADP-binding domain-containing protein [Seiridium unicorne]|uniref:6-phosphogluconate dehydrogenase NADP-binding domain-containing protein n=1 Tax=Seiridium unicorne TaxID=138068 RepID=A0ABR2VH15_9PEZI